MTKMPFDDVIETARIMMGRRHIELTDADVSILRYLYDNAD